MCNSKIPHLGGTERFQQVQFLVTNKSYNGWLADGSRYHAVLCWESHDTAVALSSVFLSGCAALLTQPQPQQLTAAPLQISSNNNPSGGNSLVLLVIVSSHLCGEAHITLGGTQLKPSVA